MNPSNLCQAPAKDLILKPKYSFSLVGFQAIADQNENLLAYLITTCIKSLESLKKGFDHSLNENHIKDLIRQGGSTLSAIDAQELAKHLERYGDVLKDGGSKTEKGHELKYSVMTEFDRVITGLKKILEMISPGKSAKTILDDSSRLFP